MNFRILSPGVSVPSKSSISNSSRKSIQTPNLTCGKLYHLYYIPTRTAVKLPVRQCSVSTEHSV